jgi:glucokinase
VTRVAFGVDIGGTKISAGAVDETGQILVRAEAPSDVDDAVEVVEVVAQLVRELARGGEGGLPPQAENSVGLGIGAAGLVDHRTGHYAFGPNTGLSDFDLGGMAAEATKLKVRIDNDANCAAWAEHRFGVGRDCRHFICVTLGTGIGGGFVFDGKPFRGAHGGAAEIGHMLVDPDGPRCGCGRNGCWEQFASGLALERMARDVYGREVRGQEITRAARDGDASALRLVEELAQWVGWGLGSLVNVLEPEKIAIAGGIARDWDLLAPRAEQAMFERIEAATRRSVPDLVAAELEHDAGIVGAALLVLEEATYA